MGRARRSAGALARRQRHRGGSQYWYPPLSDWRDGASHLDAALAANVHDLGYLEGRIEAGENYEWFYASDAARAAQTRTPIGDGAYGEPWIYRAKDLRNFWARAHYNRPAGVRAGAPTAWVAQSKPLWLIELGCPAVDKGANAPNLFSDAKSDESALPPFSSGARDDLIQRRTLDAYLRYWDQDGGNNPASTINSKPMIEEIMLWAWDARPHPAFPARTDVWSDGANWRLGHWLNGRAGLSELSEVAAQVCARAGVADADVSALTGAVNGYVVDAPASARAGLEPLMDAYDFTAAERGGRIVFFHRDDTAPLEISVGDFVADSAGEAFAQRDDAALTPLEARVRFLDPARDYLIASVSARRRDAAEGGVVSLDAPLVLEPEAAEAIAERALAEARAANESLRIGLGPQHIALEPGDCIAIGGGEAFEIARIDDAETRQLELRRVRAGAGFSLGLAEPNPPAPPALAPTPAFAVLDLAALPSAEADERPLAAVFAQPWLGTHELYAGPAQSLRARIAEPAIMGELLWALWPGPVDRWDDGNVVRIKLYHGALASVSADAVLNGANAFAIEAGAEWEIVQARNCVLTAANEYELSGFLRGRLGSAHAMAAPHPVGARIVVLDQRLARIDVAAHEWNEALTFTAPPAGALASDGRAAAATLTLPHAARRPWAPAHLRAKRQPSGDVAISWIRCARSGGDSWGPGEPPLGASSEGYQLQMLNGAALVRSVTVSSPSYVYSVADQTADFGAPPSLLRLRVAQLDDAGAPGLQIDLSAPL